jgi:hypothetical protein
MGVDLIVEDQRRLSRFLRDKGVEWSVGQRHEVCKFFHWWRRRNRAGLGLEVRSRRPWRFQLSGIYLFVFCICEDAKNKMLVSADQSL